MRVIARQGHSTYLLSREDDLAKAQADITAQAQVLDMSRGVLYPPTGLHSIYSKGYWEDCEVPAEQLAEWLKDAERLEARPASEVVGA